MQKSGIKNYEIYSTKIGVDLLLKVIWTLTGYKEFKLIHKQFVKNAFFLHLYKTRVIHMKKKIKLNFLNVANF